MQGERDRSVGKGSGMGMGDGRESSIHMDTRWDRGAVTEMFSNCQLPVSCNRE